MSFIVIGLDHSTASLDTLERVSISDPGDHEKALTELSNQLHLSEAVLLSTCNRTEVYAVAERFHGAFSDIRNFFCAISFLAPDQISDALYAHYDDEAVSHLFNVTSGVQSAVVGEHEIQGQIKRAWQTAQDFGSVGPELNKLFRAAIATGKRVRTETAISRNIASVSQAAIVLAQRNHDLSNSNALLIGAGEMGSGIAKTLSELGVKITLTSRTPATAENLASQINAKVCSYQQLELALSQCDIAFCSTAAPGSIIDTSLVERVIKRRNNKPLTLVDVAMPRDVDPEVRQYPELTVLDLEAIGEMVAEGLENRKAELHDAQIIIGQELDKFAAARGAEAVIPLVTEFRRGVEEIRQQEMQRFEARLGELDASQKEAIEAMTKAMVAKIVHKPTVRLKDAAPTLRGERLASAMSELFDLG